MLLNESLSKSIQQIKWFDIDNVQKSLLYNSELVCYHKTYRTCALEFTGFELSEPLLAEFRISGDMKKYSNLPDAGTEAIYLPQNDLLVVVWPVTGRLEI